MWTRSRGQRIQAVGLAPGQVAAQVGLGMDPGLALVAGQVRRDRTPQAVMDGLDSWEGR